MCDAAERFASRESIGPGKPAGMTEPRTTSIPPRWYRLNRRESVCPRAQIERALACWKVLEFLAIARPLGHPFTLSSLRSRGSACTRGIPHDKPTAARYFNLSADIAPSLSAFISPNARRTREADRWWLLNVYAAVRTRIRRETSLCNSIFVSYYAYVYFALTSTLDSRRTQLTNDTLLREIITVLWISRL